MLQNKDNDKTKSLRVPAPGDFAVLCTESTGLIEDCYYFSFRQSICKYNESELN
jgi:hypothetical protein